MKVQIDGQSAKIAKAGKAAELCFFAVCIFVSPCKAQAAAPLESYYDSLELSSALELKKSLHHLIKNHKKIPYTSSELDTWDVIDLADQDPLDPTKVLTIYRNTSYPKAAGGNKNYNREHSWPKSYGFPADGPANYPYTDLHHLFAADQAYNSSRGNVPYGSCEQSCTEKISFVANQTPITGEYPGQSNWRVGSGAGGTWEVWVGRRGDVARAMFYMAVRYEGGTHSEAGALEPDLELTDDVSLVLSSNTGSNVSAAYMGRLSALIDWHLSDPVDERERRRNNVVAEAQGNRNPFVDRPDLVCRVFIVGACERGTDQFESLD